ncbi:MAG: DUF4214 domain-containing protein, partial [Lachnospiraceae bacterium]|nr:DUF4214 domain-containing protein [Lachnospiraceae bacterium]
YVIGLNRVPDTAGFNQWVSNFENNKVTAAQAISNFLMSQEFADRKLSNQEAVTVAYNLCLDRDPDTSGLNTMKEFLDSGAGYDYIIKAITDSTEFATVAAVYGVTKGTAVCTEPRSQNINLTRFINRMYINVLGRNCDAGGMNYWCNEILTKSKTIRQVCTAGFFGSTEFKAKQLTDVEYVELLYRTFFDRGSDNDGRSYWIGCLTLKTRTREEMPALFEDSKEFRSLKTKFGLQ